ncbi:hypothetical protein AAHK20_32535 [Trinickia sp. YCB016]
MDTKQMKKAKDVPPTAVFAVVSNPATIFERIEGYAQTMRGALEEQSCHDDPTDIMKVVRTLEGTYLTTEF